MKVSFTYYGQAPNKTNFRRSGKGWREKWGRIKDFEEGVGWLAHQAAGGSQLRYAMDKSVTVETLAFNQRCDPDGIKKSLLDGLEGVMFLNDKDVASRAIPKKDNGEARLEVTITYEEV